MHKQRAVRTPLIAVIAVLALFAVPAVAQAHHISTTATCDVVNGAPTVNYKVQFIGFSAGARGHVNGTVKKDGTTVRTVTESSGITWVGSDGTLTGSTPGTAGATAKVDFAFTWPSGNASESKITGKCPKPKNPGIEIVKDGPSTKYVGDQATFTYKVTNTGDVVLTNPVVTDDKCAPVTKVPDGQNQFDPGDVWTYTCTTTITDAMGDQLVNVGKACADYTAPTPDQKVCDTDDHKTNIPKPAIALDKTGAATANAGETFTYTFKATNTGNVTLTNVVLTDDKCQSTLTRSEPNLSDATFDKGDEWFYTCTVVAPAGPAQVDNIADVCGDYVNPAVPTKTVCAEDTHTFTVPPADTPPVTPPVTPPGDTPPGTTPGTPPGSGEVLPEEIISGRAVLRGPSGCVKQAFKARVNGRSIASVTFSIDGRKVKTVGKGAFALTIHPNKFGVGRHRLIALVKFTQRSGTASRRLPLTFRRCAQGVVAPRFTG